ncbi:MAG: L-threonylcarbamoyladenylate synthase [Deltaproteobacteria bacterium]|nr:L-threonylcarbamoyladenylate synthase [Deltaproteobacteria bacterium]
MGIAQVFHVDRDHPRMRLVHQAAEILRRGGLIVHPTDTTYAIGAHLENKRGIEKLYTLKKKSLKRPLSYLCGDLANIAQFAQVSDEAYRTMKRLLPGPYTFILDANRNAPRTTQTQRKEIGIRIPDDPFCRALIQEVGMPVISTSAYVHGGDLLADPDDILKVLGGYVDLIVDAGIIPPEPSTIISFVGDEPTLVRQGKASLISTRRPRLRLASRKGKAILGPVFSAMLNLFPVGAS